MFMAELSIHTMGVRYSKMETIDLLTKNVLSIPQTLFNIGVGPKPHCEAEIFKEIWPDIRIVGFEPNIKTFNGRIGDYPGELYPWALWNIPSIRKLFAVTKFPGKSSILQPRSDWTGKRNFNIGKTCQEILVSCVTLDQIDEALGHPHDIFLWIDIEGAELEALRGGCSLLASGRVKWIDMEISHKARRIGEPDEDSISKFLSVYGFSLKCKYNSGTVYHNSLYIKNEK